MMNIRELLKSHFEISSLIDMKLEQIAELRALASKVTASPFSESHSKGTYTDRVGRTTARIVDLENEINAEIDKLVEVKIKIHELIAAIPDGIQRTILERHYLLNESWEIISEKVGYSCRHITRLHNQALELLEHICENKEIA